MMTSNSSKKRFTMMELKQRFINDDTKSLKRFLNDGTKKGTQQWYQNSFKKVCNNGIKTILKSFTIMVLKKFLNDDTKKVL